MAGYVPATFHLLKEGGKMSRKLEDITGRKYGKLVVERYVERRNNLHYWLCKCECGNVKVLPQTVLKNGHTQSCGCLLGNNQYGKHGKRETRLYNIWHTMKCRCTSEKRKDYKNYGGRGICVCDEWANSFLAFYEWSMNNGYSELKTIDRIDINGDYKPSNCRWASTQEQVRNRRNTIYVQENGTKIPLIVFCEQNNLDYRKEYRKFKCNSLKAVSL